MNDTLKILDYIIQDYYDENAADINSFRHKLNSLVDNNIGIKITGRGNGYYRRISTLSVILKFLDNYEEGFIENNTKILDFNDYGKIENKADVNENLADAINLQIADGYYSVHLDDQKVNGTYGILFITTEDEEVQYEFYIIGEKYKKYTKKLTKLYNKYNRLSYDSMEDELIYSNGSRKELIFKNFDKLIFRDKEKVLDYINHWIDAIPKFYEYGMVPKLSILLYGKPGTGKSTFYQALAKYLDIPTVCVITPDYFSNGLDDKYRKINSQSKAALYRDEILYAIDEIDMVNQSRDLTNDNANGHILSKLLAFLDNPPTFYFKAKDGKSYPVSIVVATTNYYDRLDSAVKRFGRFDLQLQMVDFDKELAQEMCDLYKLKLEDVIDGKIDKNFTISPAELQAKCLKNVDTNLKLVPKKKRRA